MGKIVITKERLTTFKEFLDLHNGQKGALMPVLNEAQKIFGCIPKELQKKISEKLDIPVAEIYGVITFYHQFSIEPKGDYVIGVCMGTACYVKDAQKLIDEITTEIGIKPGETTQDYKFSLVATRCVGACGLAPVVNVNEDVYGRLEGGEMKGILGKY